MPDDDVINTTGYVIFFVLFLALITVILSGMVYYYKKKTRQRIPATTWEMNDRYESEGSDNKVEEETILPHWLRVRPEMVYPHRCIEKDQELGKGQFGSVFKGRLIQGNAVYVIFFALHY